MKRRLPNHVLVVIGIFVLLALVSEAYPAEPRYPKRAPVVGGSGTWIGTTTLEIIGSAFPTLPEPYVSVEVRTVVALDGVPVSDEARATTNQRVTLSVAEATALRDALDAWLANPTTTTTLTAKQYP